MASGIIRNEVSRFTRFCGVGAVGFVIDASLLLWLTAQLEMDPFAARLVSILCAVTMTWLMHRRWTFASRTPDRLAEWGRFAAVNGVGGTLNYLVYSAVLLALPGTAPLLALVAGSALALAANYLGSRLWAFRLRRYPPLYDSQG